MLRYVQMELSKGVLPDGKRYVSERALLQRREPQVAIGNDAIYGMGLMVDRTWGVPVVHHGGDLVGFHSDMMWLPDYGVGAVILTNSDFGVVIRSPLQRRLLEVLFDGKPQAEADVAATAKRFRDYIAAERKRVVVPADASESVKLAAHYHNAALGKIAVKREGGKTIFDFGGWRSEVATRKNDDGSLSYVTISPGEGGNEFVVAEGTADRSLIVRDAQHEYRYDEVR
jgi:CubicO group peptidase (beta-lactamase class C family)